MPRPTVEERQPYQAHREARKWTPGAIHLVAERRVPGGQPGQHEKTLFEAGSSIHAIAVRSR